MDQRIESFLADVLALAGEEPDAVRDGVRVALPPSNSPVVVTLLRVWSGQPGRGSASPSWPTHCLQQGTLSGEEFFSVGLMNAFRP